LHRFEEQGEISVFDVDSDNKLSNQKRFSNCEVDGATCGPDGKMLGRIRLQEVCGNLCFGGPKRNRLFTAASQSLYAMSTATRGAGPG
jgi:gluconolactonase